MTREEYERKRRILELALKELDVEWQYQYQHRRMRYSRGLKAAVLDAIKHFDGKFSTRDIANWFRVNNKRYEGVPKQSISVTLERLVDVDDLDVVKFGRGASPKLYIRRGDELIDKSR